MIEVLRCKNQSKKLIKLIKSIIKINHYQVQVINIHRQRCLKSNHINKLILIN